MEQRGVRHFVIALTVLLALAVAGCGSKPSTAQVADTAEAAVTEIGPRPGALAPGFTANLLDGESMDLDDLRGRPVILNFWATWCGPCRREMPLLEEIGPGTKADIAILAVNYGEAVETVSAYVNDKDVSLPVVLDPDLSLARTYLIYGMPTTFLVDAQGVVQAVHTGELTEDMLAQFVEKTQTE